LLILSNSSKLKYKIGILTTHPIQYQVPWFRAFEAHPDIDLTVFFCMIPDARQQGDGFNVEFQWDIPLLEGYKYETLDNIASKPSVTRFWGCDTPGVKDIVRNGGFDAFVVNGWVVKSCIQLLFACRRFKIPCLVRGESTALKPRVWWKGMIHRLFLKQYSAFLNIGKSNKRFYIQNGVSKNRIFFAPYCVENERFEQATNKLRPETDSIRSGWGIPHKAFTFLFCAKFIDKKRPLDLLEAFSLVCKEIKSSANKVHLLMVGDGKLKSECESFAKENRLPVTFTGFLNQTEIPRAYLASDCIVLPSDFGETWGLVINEAMACGLPAIASDQVGCHPDLIISNQTGAVFPFGDVQALADLLVSFARNPDKSRAMGKAAKKLVARYNYDEVVKGTIEALKYVTSS